MQHFFSLNTKEQKETEAKEDFRRIGEVETFGDYEADLCDTCTKKYTCDLVWFDENVAECSDYGRPN